MQLVQPCAAHTAPQKRAYTRACRRAEAHPLQGTTYRGRWCSLRELRGRWQSSLSTRSGRPLRSAVSTASTGHSASCHRLKIVTLNVGGLSQAAYAELLQHLQSLPPQARPDVLLLQETHWREHSEYSTAGWHIIGSANVSPQAGGVAIFIADHLCAAEHILHTSPIPGRLLHARLTLNGATVDIVNVYQKIAVSSLLSTEKGQKPGTTNRSLRREVWTALRKLLRNLPTRHIVVVAGDFNTPVKSVNTRVGARADLLSSTPPSDQGEFMDLIHDCDLLHLNSWTRFAKYTFRHGDHASMIDHIFVRPRLRVLDKVTLAQDATVEAVNAELHSTALDLFPGKLQHGRIVPWQSEQVGMAVRTMWAAYRTWRSTAKACSQHIWRAWAAYSKFCKAHRAFRRSTRQAKTAWFKNQVEIMEVSARKGDTRALFQLAARFGPKQVRRKLQLRSEDGGILSHADQADVLHKFYKNLYSTDAPDSHAKILDSLMDHMSLVRPFACLSLDTIPQALQHLSPHKAAPSHLAHTSVWIACSDVVSPWLTRFLRSAQQIPQVWKDTWLSLLPKVATPTLPRQLRPLGISEISGRIVCGLIQDQLRPYVENFLSNEPQFAYMANRSTDQALLRVLLHCTEGRRMCEPQVYDLRQARFSCSQSRSSSASKQARGGAIQLSLDLTQAFDRLEWGLISDALIAASVPVELYSLIILWHRSLYYHLKVVDATAAVPVQRGVRRNHSPK
ncbi:putative 149 kDa protein [Symbiodinium microadriaticum]|uniref:Putative 149 kDa protein n=1 Tax=Symbiodinium microadriaticum TaxID=2951 RepID=A0A1Q9EKD0_SYMMI|nr:putative 149 kDa protein [Symbiodinium microadriaticum]